MKLFIAGFEKDRDVHRASSDLDDEDDDAPFVGASTAAAKSSASSTAAVEAVKSNADLSVTPATDRQVQFIGTLGRELGMDNVALDDFAVGIVGHSLGVLTRKQASTVIDALQRERVNDAAGQEREDGKDELVAVGVSKKSLEDDDTSFD
jgi:hypothetical protein